MDIQIALPLATGSPNEPAVFKIGFLVLFLVVAIYAVTMYIRRRRR